MRKKWLKFSLALSAFCLSASFASFAAEDEVLTGWVEGEDGWMYYDEDGYQVTDEWKKSGDNWFYLGSDGYILYEQLVEYDDYIYYVNEDGAMVKNQWVQMANEESDDADSENAAVDVWYYFQNNGRAYVAGDNGTSFKTINGKKYAFDEDGKMLWGWVNDNSELCNAETEWHDAVYYCGAENDGAMKTGWQLIDVEEDRENLEKNKDDDTVMYYYFYFMANGKRVQGDTKTINGEKYSFDEYGAMDYEWTIASDSVASMSQASPSEYYQWFNWEDYGNRVKGWFYTIPSENLNKKDYDDEMEHWYYALNGGSLVTSEIKTINGKKYAFNDKSEMLTGLQALKIDPSNPSHILASYPVEDENAWEAFLNQNPAYSGDRGTYDYTDTMLYYFGDDEDEDGAMRVGKLKVELSGDTYNYYFLKSGTYKGVAFGSQTGLARNYEGTFSDDENDLAVSFIKDGYIYREGRRITADDDLRYEPVNKFGVKATSSDELKNFYLVNTSGQIQKNRHNTKDQDGNYYCTDKNGKITYFGTEKCNNHNKDAWHEYDSSKED